MSNHTKFCKRCGTPFGTRTKGCHACYMREVYYKKPGKREKRAEACRRRYAEIKQDPERLQAELNNRRQWALNNPEKRKEIGRKSSAKLRKKRQEILNDAKDKPCADCGREYPPAVMDLHHTRGEKVAAVSKMLVNASLEDFLAEIDKCDVLCANCHRMRHNLDTIDT